MSTKPQWTVEHGSLWALETINNLPPRCSARVETVFEELPKDGVDDLTVAMNLSSPDMIYERFQSNRRCFVLKIANQIATYGWVTHGEEAVGELERKFQLHDNEAYIWDCATVLAHRGQRCYSALLSHMIYQLHRENTPCIWIGASRENLPSIKGFANAGFQPVLDLTYRRFYRLTILRLYNISATWPRLVKAAYRMLVNDHERRVGQFAFGWHRQ